MLRRMMQQTATISSNEAGGAGSASRIERRLLIDGQLLETERTFPSINPATGAVLGYAPDATVGHAEAAVAAARRAFDTTDWSTNTAVRIRCPEQFHRALVDHRPKLAPPPIPEDGPTASPRQPPQSDPPD